eukprot:CAMPEP_0119058234 /NCGR_PEP_ID=MMETSP1178-20130426/2597_1 /TAXON_ID=33656 /ORGANISM="unid sp, Strain CCMP2000" /LENGTH=134 /DNA_ID=CAMNT_0007039143 /DNA_START=38 /DNA_END=442 /DNA_ORIENTATION=-
MPAAEKKEAPNAAPAAGVLLLHGLYLAAFGSFGAAQHDWAPKAMHSAYAGAGGGGALVLCSLLSISGSYKLYMIGVHLALLLQLLFTFVFVLQAYKSYGVPEKQDRFPLFVAMGLGSVVALGMMRIVKPKKKKA